MGISIIQSSTRENMQSQTNTEDMSSATQNATDKMPQVNIAQNEDYHAKDEIITVNAEILNYVALQHGLKKLTRFPIPVAVSGKASAWLDGGFVYVAERH